MRVELQKVDRKYFLILKIKQIQIIQIIRTISIKICLDRNIITIS